jgi:hypothetical protein
MIHAVDIAGLRGVQAGKLDNLPPLSILVGRNGAGKSTVLEALAIGGAHQPAVLVGQVVQGRGGWNGASYLVKRGEVEARVRTSFASGEERSITLRFDERPTGLGGHELPPGHLPGPTAGPFAAILARVERGGAFRAGLGEGGPGDVLDARTVFDVGNAYTGSLVRGLGLEDRLRLVVPATSRGYPLWKTLGDAVKAGRADEVFSLLRELLGDEFRDLYPIPESDAGPMTNVHLRYSWGTVPVDVAGDGVRSLVRIALELAGRPDSVILVEEPEIHQHPGSLQQTALALLAATARGVQVVVSTHSLELIDNIVALADPAALGRLAVYRLALVAGALRSYRIAGEQVRTLRQDVAEELR